MRWRRAQVPPRAVLRANGHECEREPGWLESVPMPVELRLQKDGRGRGFDRGGWGRGCRHAGRRADYEAGVTGKDQQEPEGDTSSECPEVSGPPIHQH